METGILIFTFILLLIILVDWKLLGHRRRPRNNNDSLVRPLKNNTVSRSQIFNLAHPVSLPAVIVSRYDDPSRIRKVIRDPKFVKCTHLLTENELLFYRQMISALPDSVWICSKVRLESLIRMGKTSDKSMWFKGRGFIRAREIDFVLCDKSSSEILCAIELDDRSHLRRIVMNRDKNIERWLRDARVTLFRYPSTRYYNFYGLNDYLRSCGHCN